MNLFFYLFYLIIFTAKLIGLYDGHKLFYGFMAIGLLFYVLKILTTKMSVLEYTVTALLMGMAAVVYVCSGEKGLLLCMAVITGMKGVDRVKLIKLTAFIGSIIFLFMILLTSLGVIPDKHHITEKFGGMILRRDFGQPGSNVTHTVVFVLISMIIFLYGRGKNIIKLSVYMMILNVLCFAYTLSITGFLSITVLLAINLFFSKISNINTKGYSYASNVIYFLAVVLSIVSPLLIKGQAFDILNKVLNHRLEYGRYFLINEHLSLFGSRFASAPNINYYLDNSFLYLFLQLGVVTFFVTMLILFLALNGMLQSNDIRALIMFISYTFIGLSDPFLFNTSFKNVTLIFAGMYLFKFLECANLRYGLKSRCMMDLKRMKLNDYGDRIYAWISDTVDLIGVNFDRNANLILLLLTILPVIGVVIYYICPQLYDVSFLAAGDRLVYDYEANVQHNHSINRLFCVLRTGVIDGFFVSIILITGKAIYERRIIHNNNSML